MKKRILLPLMMVAAGLCSGQAPAKAAITFTGVSGTRAASVTFSDVVAGQMTVTLTNTSTADVLVPTDVLTAVFFDIDPVSTTLGRVSAVVAPLSTVLFGVTDPGGVVGGEWAYKSGLAGTPGNTALGVSSSGLGLFSPGDNFPGSNLSGPVEVDGLQYGITSAGDDPTTGNKAVTGQEEYNNKGKLISPKNPLIKNSVVFTFSVTGPIDTIKNVSFQYGTALTEPNVPGSPIPEPASLAVWSLLGLVGLVRARRKLAS
jgi:hypothetical protein